MRTTSLVGEVAVVTGAGAGIGAACAQVLADHGAAVLVTDRDAAAAHAVAAQVVEAGGCAVGYELDVLDGSAIAAVVHDARELLGPVSVLVNNAAATDLSGSGRDSDILTMDVEVWDRTFAVNLRGAMLLCRELLPDMLTAGRGAIVNVSSGAARAAEHTRPAYGASKAGLESLTRALATAYGPQGVRCNAVAPGLTLTDAVRGPGRGIERMREVFRRHTPSPLGGADDVALVVAFLASDQARYVNGAVVAVDGGLHAAQPYVADFLRR